MVLNAALQYRLDGGPASLQAAALLRRAQCLAEGLAARHDARPGCSRDQSSTVRASSPTGRDRGFRG
jgi:hypothetical protein